MWRETENAAVAADPAVIPLPPVILTSDVVLLGFLLARGTPVLLDAAEVTDIEPAAEPMLEAVLLAAREADVDVRVVRADARLRERYAASPIAPYLDSGVFADDEALFLAPERDAAGFLPSLR